MPPPHTHTPRACWQHVSLGRPPEPCVLWKGPSTFVRQGILTPSRDRGGFASPVLSGWLGCVPQKQNVYFPIARVLEGSLAWASTPSVSGQAICPLGAWCRNNVCQCGLGEEGRHSAGSQGSGPPSPVLAHSTLGTSGLCRYTSQARWG